MPHGHGGTPKPQSHGHGKPKTNGSAVSQEEQKSSFKQAAIEKKQKRIAKRKEKVNALLHAATSIKEENVYMAAFERLEMVETENNDTSNIKKIKYLVKTNGLQKDDPRIKVQMEHLSELEKAGQDLDFEGFKKEFQSCFKLFRRLLDYHFIMTDYPEFAEGATKIFEEVKNMPNEGIIPDYIPALQDVNEDGFAVSICTVDGQMINLGDYDERTCLHAISGVISYMLAQQQLGEDTLSEYIGAEHSGGQFNALELMSTGIPHNPLNCAGSLMSSALIYRGESTAKKYEKYAGVVKRLIGGHAVSFNNEMFLSEVYKAHANYSLLYMMEEHGTLPVESDIKKTLQFYTQCCSVHLRVKDLAVLAATFANGGICPITDERCFQDSNAVKLCLSHMLASGMNTKSGQWAFDIGLPTKSAISGGTIMIVPNLCGICVWSPKVNKDCNSNKGEIFLRKFVEEFQYNDIDHQYGAGEFKKKLLNKEHLGDVSSVLLLYQAKKGNLREIRRSVALGRDVNYQDYDKRTALHVAACNGHLEVVKYLINHDAVIDFEDRFGNTPIDEARNSGYKEIEEYLISMKE